MPCIQHNEQCLTHCAVSSCENWNSLTENFARVWAVWVSVKPNIRWHYEVLMWSSQSDVCKLIRFTQHVSVVEQHEKLCFIVPSFEAGTILLSKICCHFMQWNICYGFYVIGCGIYVQFRKF